MKEKEGSRERRKEIDKRELKYKKEKYKIKRVEKREEENEMR